MGRVLKFNSQPQLSNGQVLEGELVYLRPLPRGNVRGTWIPATPPPEDGWLQLLAAGLFGGAVALLFVFVIGWW